MNNLVQQCIDLIIGDDVDEVLWALIETYSWYFEKTFSGEGHKNNHVLQQFLDQISLSLVQREHPRRVIIGQEANITFRNKEGIGKIIQPFLGPLSAAEGIEFLGN